MDTKEMVITELTPDLVDDGERLVRQLDSMGYDPDAAFWMLFPEYEAWRLAIYQPHLINNGPQEGYRKVQKAIEKLDPAPQNLSLHDVFLLPPTARVLNPLRAAARTGPGISRIRFPNTVVGGELIPDAMLYRIR